MDPASILALVKAADTAVGLFDKIAGQIKSVLMRRPQEDEANEDRWRHKVRGDKNKIIVSQDGHEIQVITAEDIAKLPENYLALIQTLETTMDRNYRLWQAVYKKKGMSPDPLLEAQIEEQLRSLIKQMGSDLLGIIGFLESLGLHLDDHYMHVRHLIQEA